MMKQMSGQGASGDRFSALATGEVITAAPIKRAFDSAPASLAYRVRESSFYCQVPTHAIQCAD